MIEFRVNKRSGVIEAWSNGNYVCDIDGFEDEERTREDVVESYRRRRKKRLDGKAVDEYKERRASRRQMRNDAEEPASWITVNGNHIPLDETGEAIGGQPKALGRVGRPSSKLKAMKSSLNKSQREKYTAQFKEFATRMTELNRQRKMEEKGVEKQRGVPYNDRDFTRLWDCNKKIEDLKNEICETVAEMPSGTIISQGVGVYEKEGDGWSFYFPGNTDVRKDLKDSDVGDWLSGRGSESAVRAALFPENSEEIEQVCALEKKSDEMYKDFADAINNLDKKGVVAKAKKDPDFKTLVDSISLYTQGAYGDQKRLANEMVSEGLDEVSMETIGDYMDGFYDIKQLWNGQKLSESNGLIGEGVLSMIGAINNSAPTQKNLYRVEGSIKGWKGYGDEGSLYVPPKPGEIIAFDAPTSFTKSLSVEKELRSYKYGDQIHYVLEPGASALDIERLSRYKQQESITCGKFEVVDVKYPTMHWGWKQEEVADKWAEEVRLREQGVEHDYAQLEVTITLRQVGKTEIGGREDSEDHVIRYDDQFNDRMGLEFVDPVEKYKRRRTARLKMRMDAEEPASWITVNGNHIPLNEEGEAIGGQPKALGEGVSGGKATGTKGSIATTRSVQRTTYENFLKPLKDAQDVYKAKRELDHKCAVEMQRLWDEGDDEGAEAVRVEWKAQAKEYDKAYEQLKESEKAFRNCGAWDDFENKIGSILGRSGYVNLKGMDYELAEDTVKAFENVFTKYPMLKESVKAVTFRDPISAIFGENGIAAFDVNSGELFLNSDFFGAGNKEKGVEMYAKDVEKQFHPAGTNLMSCVYHEIGHAFDAYISRELFGHKYTWGGESVSRRLWNNEINAAEKRGEPLTGKSMREMLSGYAGKSPAEYLAEGFSEYMTSASPRPAAVRTGKMIEKYIKKLEAHK